MQIFFDKTANIFSPCAGDGGGVQRGHAAAGERGGGPAAGVLGHGGAAGRDPGLGPERHLPAVQQVRTHKIVLLLTSQYLDPHPGLFSGTSKRCTTRSRLVCASTTAGGAARLCVTTAPPRDPSSRTRVTSTQSGEEDTLSIPPSYHGYKCVPVVECARTATST